MMIMKRNDFPDRIIFRYLCIALLSLLPLAGRGQQNIIINMAPIDGLPITPDNIFNYQMQCTGSGTAQVKGTIRYRNSNLSISYSFNCTLRQGLNMLTADEIHPQWQFSSGALQELFFTYKMLPEGTYEYCVTITPNKGLKESAGNSFEECLYHRAEDIFLINLIDPEDKAKLKEYNPLLVWVANYSFSNELTYRIRVAEIQHGQNPVNAVLRNQPVYDESNLFQNSIVYPIYAKPLVANQPYAWTVDAYYKGILLGGSETWQFIIPDTIAKPLQANRSYIDIKRENGAVKLSATGDLRIKYTLEKYRTDSLSLQLFNDKNKKVALKPEKLKAVYGDNRYILNLQDSSQVTHMKAYNLVITTGTGERYSLPFTYINPDYGH